MRLSYLASRARTHAKRARTRTACRQSHPRGPLTPLQTSLITRKCASHRYLLITLRASETVLRRRKLSYGCIVSKKSKCKQCMTAIAYHNELDAFRRGYLPASLVSLRQQKKPGHEGRAPKKGKRDWLSQHEMILIVIISKPFRNYKAPKAIAKKRKQTNKIDFCPVHVANIIKLFKVTNF